MLDKLIVCAVLGASNDQDGNLCSDAIQRCDLALEILSDNKNSKVILCGGMVNILILQTLNTINTLSLI